MGTDLPGLEHGLSLIQRASIGIELAQGFDRIPGMGLDVHGRVHDSICACTHDAFETKPSTKKTS